MTSSSGTDCSNCFTSTSSTWTSGVLVSRSSICDAIVELGTSEFDSKKISQLPGLVSTVSSFLLSHRTRWKSMAAPEVQVFTSEVVKSALKTCWFSEFFSNFQANCTSWTGWTIYKKPENLGPLECFVVFNNCILISNRIEQVK